MASRPALEQVSRKAFRMERAGRGFGGFGDPGALCSPRNGSTAILGRFALSPPGPPLNRGSTRRRAAARSAPAVPSAG